MGQVEVIKDSVPILKDTGLPDSVSVVSLGRVHRDTTIRIVNPETKTVCAKGTVSWMKIQKNLGKIPESTYDL